MASRIDDVEIRLRARTDELEKELNAANRKLDAFAKKGAVGFKDLDSAVGKVASGLRGLGAIAGIAGVGALGTSLVAATRHALDFSSELVDTARNVGISTDALQELRFAATQSGVTIEQLDIALRYLNKSMGDAAGGQKRVADAFHRLGISIADGNGRLRDTGDVLTEVLTRLGELSSAAERTSVANKILGESGAQVGKLALEGADGIDALRARAHELGLVIDASVLGKAKEAGDQFAALGNILEVVAVQGVLEFRQELVDLAEWLIEATRLARDFIDTFRLPINRTGIEGISEGIDTIDSKLESLEKQRANVLNGDFSTQFLGDLGIIETDVDKLTKTIEGLRKERDALLERRASRTVGAASPGISQEPGLNRLLEAEKVAAARSAELRKEALAAERELARTRTESAAAIEQEARKEEASLAKIINLTERRIEAEIEAADAAGDQDTALKKRIELIEERYQRERLEIQRTVTETDSLQQAYSDLDTVRAEAIAKAKRDADEAAKSYEGLADVLKRGISDALADLALTGKLSFESLGQSFLREFIQVSLEGLAKLIAQLEIVKAIEAGIGSFGFGTDNTVPTTASGGLVTRPQLRLVGEAGPEAIIPLSRLQRATGGGGGLNVTVINQVPEASVQVVQRDSQRTEILINRKVAQSARSPQFAEALKDGYGVTRVGTRRA